MLLCPHMQHLEWGDPHGLVCTRASTGCNYTRYAHAPSPATQTSHASHLHHTCMSKPAAGAWSAVPVLVACNCGAACRPHWQEPSACQLNLRHRFRGCSHATHPACDVCKYSVGLLLRWHASDVGRNAPDTWHGMIQYDEGE